MYDHSDVEKWSGTKRVGEADVTREECRRARHLHAYGPLGLPGGGSAGRPGHGQPIGLQGNPRRAVETRAGCAEEHLSRALRANTPLLLRGCVAERSPRVLEWTTEYLSRVAGNHSTRFCPDRLDEYLAQGMPYYRNCGALPRALLADVALPEALRDVRSHMDNAVLWTGNLSFFGKSSPLHFDPNDNLMHLVDGEKRILLIDPVESALLYADFANNSFGNSPVDPRAVDLQEYPLAARVTLWPVTVTKGDVLYIPSGWWHVVTTRRGRNVALTLQFNPLVASDGKHEYSFTHANAKLSVRHRAPPAPRGDAADAPAAPLTLADAHFDSTAQLLQPRKRDDEPGLDQLGRGQ